jgi:predicted MFS family arabinose efflux permease
MREWTISYLAELRANWRPIAAATFGLGTGFAALSTYTPGIIAPHLLREFGWSKSAFAFVMTITAISGLIIPFVGRMADQIGVRWTVLPGIVVLPISYIVFSLMTGAIEQYVGIMLVQILFCVAMTSTVYSRLAVQYSEKARGLALAIVASGPALTGVFLGPLLNVFIEANGWRATYHLLAGISLVSGIVTLMMLPKGSARTGESAPPKRRAREDYPVIFRTPAFWLIIAIMILCNLPNILGLSQMKLLMLDNGVSGEGASVMLSAFAIGVLVGRFVVGFSLDRFPAHLVGLLAMGLPSIGLLLIASSLDAAAMLTFAVFLLGMAFGAEADLVAYIIAQHFGVRIFSSVFGLATLAVTIGTSLGSAVLSVTIKATGNYNLFLLISAASVIAGSLLFLPLGRKTPGPAAVEAA